MNTKILGLVSQGELGEVALQVIVAADGPVVTDDEQLLVFRPSQTLDGALVPGDAFQKLASATVNVDAGL